MADGNVTFCSHFKYLGSWVSFFLRDDHNVANRVPSTNVSMGEIASFWYYDHVNMYSKYLMFQSIPCNFLLWGCESWDLRQTLLGALEVFLHRSVRRILRIKARHVIEHRINNERVRKKHLTYRRFATKFPFFNSLTSENRQKRKYSHSHAPPYCMVRPPSQSGQTNPRKQAVYRPKYSTGHTQG